MKSKSHVILTHGIYLINDVCVLFLIFITVARLKLQRLKHEVCFTVTLDLLFCFLVLNMIEDFSNAIEKYPSHI